MKSLRPITRVLIANRGEIARRIQRTCREMGIETVAVFSDADAEMPFVREADRAIRIGPAPSRESYLKVEAILDAAKRTGADAIHPGYGFLAENADFARAVKDAGLIFVGPTPEAIDAMGRKREAKALVAEAGVPVVPGYAGSEQDADTLGAEAAKIGYPVLLKASAGGGGKGMKRVDSAEGLADAIESAKREAKSGFGDDTLILEKYVERPRHVEIQIFGDAHGNVVHLHERECSIQRRHQKILEESPSPALDAELRARMGEAAVAAGKAIGYQNAGTVEFILAEDGAFYFLEVNTRLQVEHPVTEAITGLDLVRLQLRVAAGHALPFTQSAVPRHGAALEARVYAEDPASGHLPQTGVIRDWFLPELAGVRVDAGVETGTSVGVHYDPMLAKIITSGVDREEARVRMVHALRALSVQGLVTNRELLLAILEHPAYVQGALHTHFLDHHAIAAAPPSEASMRRALVAALLFDRHHRVERADLPRLAGFRNNPFSPQSVTYRVGDAEHALSYGDAPLLFRHIAGSVTVDGAHARVLEVSGSDAHGTIRLEFDGEIFLARVTAYEDRRFVHQLGDSLAFRVLPRFPRKEIERPAGACIAPMPGTVVRVDVAVGDEVNAGQRLLVLEAMKMEHTLNAPSDGKVESLAVVVGDQVEADAILAVIASD